MPLPAIIHKTKSDWPFLKGHVKYVELVVIGSSFVLPMSRIKRWCGGVDLGLWVALILFLQAGFLSLTLFRLVLVGLINGSECLGSLGSFGT